MKDPRLTPTARKPSEPNMQVIVPRTEIGEKLRAAFRRHIEEKTND